MACIKSDTAAICSKLVSVLGKGWKIIKTDNKIKLYKYINKYCEGLDYYSLLENFIEESNLNIKGVLSDYITSYFNIPDFLKVSSIEELIFKLELMSIGPDKKC